MCAAYSVSHKKNVVSCHIIYYDGHYWHFSYLFFQCIMLITSQSKNYFSGNSFRIPYESTSHCQSSNSIPFTEMCRLPLIYIVQLSIWKKELQRCLPLHKKKLVLHMRQKNKFLLWNKMC